MRKVGLVIVFVALVFSVYLQADSESITVLDVKRVGDRLISSEEISQMISSSESLDLSVDLIKDGEFYGIQYQGDLFSITDSDHQVYYQSNQPLRLLASFGDNWLIARQTIDGWELINYHHEDQVESVITNLYGAELGQVIVWKNKVYIESKSTYKGDVIYCYSPTTKDLSIFVENGFEPRLYNNRLYYVYRKGESLGIESVSFDGIDRTSFAPEYSDIYSYFFQSGQIDLLSYTEQAEGVHFLRINDAFGKAEIEKFELFDARFQSENLVFGTNGKRDSLFLVDTLIQIPTDMHFRSLFDDWVYYVYQDQHYRIPIGTLESILQTK